MLCARAALQRPRLLSGSYETQHPKHALHLSGRNSCSQSSIMDDGTPSFPHIPSNARTQCLPLYTTGPALVLSALHVSLLGQRQPWQTGSLLSSTRCFPEQETSLPFLSVFLLALYRTSSTYRKRVQIPRLYVTQLPIFKTVLSI